MKRRFRNLSYLLLALALWFGTGCQGKATPQPTATPSTSTYTPLKSGQGDIITALGTVRPAQTLQLSFISAGPVRVVAPGLGTEVKAGELLAELDTTALELALESAQQEVAARQAALDKLLSGPDEASVARAERDHAQQVAQAQVALRIAQLQLEQARSQDPAPAVEIAQLGQQQAALQVEQARAHPPTPEVAVAQVDLARARDALARAQDAYRKALDRPWEPQEVRDGLTRAVQQAEWEAQSAQARLEAAQNAQRAHQLGVNALGVQTGIADAQARQAVSAQRAYTATLALLTAQVEKAQLALEGLKAWTNPLLDPTAPQEIAQAEARVRQAELEASQLARQIAGTTLRAPFDGVISAVYIHPGEWAAPGAPVVEILDTGQWIVETRNVSELAIGRVRVGQEASVQVIPFGDERLHGQVEAISPVAVVQQGDTTYTLMIALDPTGLNLRPGMNAQVEIQTGD